MTLVLNTVIPVFAIVALGYLLGGRRGVEVRTLADLSLMVASPALLFSVLGGTEIDTARMAVLCGGTAFAVAGTGVMAFAYVRAARVGRGLVLPSVFWNSGNMGLAFARLAFGEEGLQAAAVVFVSIAFFNSLFGIWVAKGESGLSESIRMPLLYGAAGGIGLALTGTELPRVFMEPVEMLGAMSISIILLSLGLQLRSLRVEDAWHASAAVAIRMLGGFGCMSLFVALAGVTGVDRQVLILISVMPPAVINAAIAQRYGTDPALVASAIVLGTFCSLASIPLVLLLLV
jgi:predicted permease